MILLILTVPGEEEVEPLLSTKMASHFWLRAEGEGVEYLEQVSTHAYVIGILSSLSMANKFCSLRRSSFTQNKTSDIIKYLNSNLKTSRQLFIFWVVFLKFERLLTYRHYECSLSRYNGPLVVCQDKFQVLGKTFSFQ